MTKTLDSDFWIGLGMCIFIVYLVSGMAFAFLTADQRVVPLDVGDYPYETLR